MHQSPEIVPDTVFGLDTTFVLASRSPRRIDLLRRLGLDPHVQPSDAPEELLPGEPPKALVQRLALAKAETIAATHKEALVLGADTVVVLDSEVLGKPESAAEARHMLRRLSGQTHAVFTGIALVHPASGRMRTDYAMTRVTFGDLSEREIAAYVAGGSPLDKAGAYGIQDDTGALFIDRIDGDYYNVVGLPLRTLYLLVSREFPDLLGDATVGGRHD